MRRIASGLVSWGRARRALWPFALAIGLLGADIATAAEYVVCGPVRRCPLPCGIWGVLDLTTNEMVPNQYDIKLAIDPDARRQTFGDPPEFDPDGIYAGHHVVDGVYNNDPNSPTFRLLRFLRPATSEQTKLCRVLWHKQRGLPLRPW